MTDILLSVAIVGFTIAMVAYKKSSPSGCHQVNIPWHSPFLVVASLARVVFITISLSLR
jgi:hypothetical protein